MGVFEKQRAPEERPVPRCCGYCQSREVRRHCPVSCPGSRCYWVRCIKCKALSGYSRAFPRDGEQRGGLTWRLIFTKGDRAGYGPENAVPG